MTAKIRITQTPPGSAPNHIRDDWVGVEIPLAKDPAGEEDGFWSGTENSGGHMVNMVDAIEALRAAGKEEAAEYWEDVRQASGFQLRFLTECCELIDD